MVMLVLAQASMQVNFIKQSLFRKMRSRIPSDVHGIRVALQRAAKHVCVCGRVSVWCVWCVCVCVCVCFECVRVCNQWI